MKSIIKIIFIASAAFVISSASAQCNMMNMSSHDSHGSAHDMKGMNDGEIIKTGNYQFEMVHEQVLKNDPFTIYVMNKKGKPLLNADISGKAEITYSDGSAETVTLFAKGENAYAVPLKNTSLPFVALLTMQIDKKNVTLRHEYQGTNTSQNNSANSYYTCPMHPEVKSDKPGNCPKCGMTLQKSDSK